MIIALLGKAGSGKDTAARYIQDALPVGEVGSLSLAAPLKKFVQEVFDFSDEQLYGPSAARNRPDKRYPASPAIQVNGVELPATYLTPRFALQTLGTEWGRSCYENVWVDLALRKAKAILEAKGSGHWTRPPKHVVITDCRFLNEAKAIRAAGGVVWRIVRHDIASVGAHASETEQDSEEMLKYVSLTTLNTGSLEEFAWNVRTALRILIP